MAGPDREARDALELIADARLRADRGFGRQVFSSGKALRLIDPSPETVVASRPELAPYTQRFGIRSAIFAPMRARGRALGLLTVLRRRGGASHTADDERLVQVVADWLAVAAASAGEQDLLPTTAASGREPRDLSEREREILALLALGHTNREIAERLSSASGRSSGIGPGSTGNWASADARRSPGGRGPSA